MKTIIVGNGSNLKILNESYNSAIAANSSISRISNLKCTKSLVLSESLLWDKEKLLLAKDINSENPFDSKRSLQIRLEKQKALEGSEVNDLVILSNERDINYAKRLEDLKINYDNLKILSHLGRIKMIIKVIGVLNLFMYFLKKDINILIKFFLSILKVYLGGRMPLAFRASTGLICIFYALSKKENNIEISGIGNNSGNHSFYNSIYVENKSLHSIDQDFLKILSNKFSLTFHN
tara:strand:+ start:7068 stop:7772 length:705 start_codon:yes stop_codon:yes gene_type:complete